MILSMQTGTCSGLTVICQGFFHIFEKEFLCIWTLKLNVHSNGHNIVGQQLPTLLDVTCCMLLGVVAESLKPVKLLKLCKTDATLLNSNSQQCWEFLRLFAVVA